MALATPGLLRAEPGSDACKLCSLHLEVGMNRRLVEEKVAAVLGNKSSYSPMANNLTGGTISYREKGWVLQVTYRAGASAPSIRGHAGTVQDLQPIDETVLGYVLLKESWSPDH
jgi:hypothetical protein